MRAVRGRANQALLLAVCLFAGAVALNVVYAGNGAARALLTVAEASLAGGVADWFAVTALFRRPFGFPYHTALIPRNRHRLIDGLVNAVEMDFLSKEAIGTRVSKANILDKLVIFAANINKRLFIRQTVDKLIDGFVDTVDAEAAAKYTERVLKLILKRQSVAPHAATAIRWSLDQGKGQAIYSAIIIELATLARAESTRERIYHYLEQVKQKTAEKDWFSSIVTGFMESIDGINVADAADALHQELVRMIDELQQAAHPARHWFETQLEMFVAKLETPEWEQAINTWKDCLVSRFSLTEPLIPLTVAGLTLLKQPSDYRDSVAEWLTDQAEFCWGRFAQCPLAQQLVERYLQGVIRNIVNHEHQLVGQVSRHALQKLSDSDLSRFVEEKAGEDLEWIRINGVIVGGLAGLVLAVFKALL